MDFGSHLVCSGQSGAEELSLPVQQEDTGLWGAGSLKGWKGEGDFGLNLDLGPCSHLIVVSEVSWEGRDSQPDDSVAYLK